jgi:RHS repeat-associated protein
VILVTDSTGKVQDSYSYDPLGNSLGKTESVVNPWQFAGGYLDATTGLYKFGTRYYNPTVGRWTQPDPKGGNITDINSLARYAYADNDPINLTDSSGKDCVTDIFLSVLGAVVAGVPFLATVILLLASANALPGEALFIEAGLDAFFSILSAVSLVMVTITVLGVILAAIAFANAMAECQGGEPYQF